MAFILVPGHREHLYRDLKPYLCTFVECQTPSQTYETPLEWKYHEMQMYRRCWICRLCKEMFPVKGLMAAHLLETHSGGFWGNERRLAQVLDVCERPVEEDSFVTCPLCSDVFLLNELFDHLAKHMERIALYQLHFSESGALYAANRKKKRTYPIVGSRSKEMALEDHRSSDHENLLNQTREKVSRGVRIPEKPPSGLKSGPLRPGEKASDDDKNSG